MRFRFRNYFKTREEAFSALDRVRAALKGDKSVVKENLTTEQTEQLVESLDGKPLKLEEMALVRDFREYKAKGDNRIFMAVSGYEADLIGSIRQMIKEAAK